MTTLEHRLLRPHHHILLEFQGKPSGGPVLKVTVLTSVSELRTLIPPLIRQATLGQMCRILGRLTAMDYEVFRNAHLNRSSRIPSNPPQSGSYPLRQPSQAPSASSDHNVTILETPRKPQCWDHGCNGRQFSTFSNLLRHQREKSGTATKSYCPRCGAEFTRTTARNGHMAHEKCKPRPQS